MSHRSVVRAFQRPVTAVLPHPGNKRYAVPKRRKPFAGGRTVFLFDGLASHIATDIISPGDSAGAIEVSYVAAVVGISQYLMEQASNVDLLRLNAGGAVSAARGALFATSSGVTMVPDRVYKLRTEWDGALGSFAVQRLLLDDINVSDGTTGPTDAPTTAIVGGRQALVADFFEGALYDVKFWFTTNPTLSPGALPEIALRIDEGSGTALINSGTLGAAGDQTLTPGAGSWGTI